MLPGIIGTIQATEAIKLLLGIGEPLIGRFLIYDALRMRFRELKLREGSGMRGLRRASDDPELRRVRGYCSPADAATRCHCAERSRT